MKMRSLFLLSPLALLTLLTTQPAFADEDSAEFLEQPTLSEDAAAPADAANFQAADDDSAAFTQRILNKVQGTGTWAFNFLWVKPTGEVEVLTHYRETSKIKPASTMKLFTGWMAYQKRDSGADTAQVRELQRQVTDEYLSHMLKMSSNVQANNAMALSGGLTAYKAFYSESIGLGDENFKPIDGCGLSHSNRVTAKLETDLLQMILKSPDYDTFKNFLSTPSDGTLGEEYRFSDFTLPLYAKTGTLGETASLAGFVELGDQKGTLVFSMISNQLTNGLAAARKIIDKTVQDHVDFVDTLIEQERLRNSYYPAAQGTTQNPWQLPGSSNAPESDNPRPQN